VDAAEPAAGTPAALAQAMEGRRIVILGEVHDNGTQHALRLAALRLVIAGGARPAIAFEQFDRERQADIDRARRERPGDAAYLIGQAGGAPSWNWDFYRPFVQLALDTGLPIVAANLSRDEAMKVATGAVPMKPPPADALVSRHEAPIAKGHCDLLPASTLPAMARAQIARDRALAAAIRPHAARGVVLLTGNGHARTDIGAPIWLEPAERAESVSIALLERGDDASDAGAFDIVFVTEPVDRPDPCVALRQRMSAPR